MTDDSIKILIIEDNPGDIRLIEEMLRESNTSRFEPNSAKSLSEGLVILKKEKIDIVILDMGLPDSYGMNTGNKNS